MNIDFKLLKHQHEFLSDNETRFLALVAGYGAGKTYSACLKAIYLAWLNVGFTGCLTEPTNAMCSDVLVPDLTALLNEYEVPFEFRASPYPTFKLYFEEGVSTILIRSAENYRRLAGLNLAWFGCDEVDTINSTIAIKMWRLLQSRLRAKAPYPQGFTTSTPEGYGFLHSYFVKDVETAEREGKSITDRRLIRARTYDNPFLEPDYIPSLLAAYPENLIKAYLNGEFVNLNTGSVYPNFNRTQNFTNRVIEDFDVYNDRNQLIESAHLHIGVDFNVNKTCGIVHCVEDNLLYAVDEITAQKNTEALINAIRHKYPDRKITIYPDSSGKSEKTNASTTDIKLLKQHFNVRHNNKNPPVKDRVNGMNAMFRNGDGVIRYYVNTRTCPEYTRSLEAQAYTEQGAPDKMHDTDHTNDASGYLVFKLFPVRAHHRTVKIVGI